MGDRSPHLLSSTIGGCFLVVSALAVAVVIGILIVVGLALLPLILLPALLTRSRGSEGPGADSRAARR